MATRPKYSEQEILEKFRVTFANLVNQKTIATTMAEYGYTPEETSIGKQLFESAINAINFNKQEGNETIASRANFDSRLLWLTDTYASHRRKAKVIFRKDPVTLKQLGLWGRYSHAYVKLVALMKTFYNGILSNPDHIAKLAAYKISEDEIKNCITEISALETSRQLYLNEVGESQEATKLKDKAMSELVEWMDDLYSVAKIAMEDQPQLLESIGVFVRS